MAMMEYFGAFGTQIARLRAESGTVSAISGIFKAPFDIIADKLRGYLGLVDDLYERRDKVLAACEALMPHLLHVARSTADPDRHVPVGYWMHRGCVPFVSPEIFKNVYWATLKPIIEELWADGHPDALLRRGQVGHAPASRSPSCPTGASSTTSTRATSSRPTRCSGDKFCLSGGISNVLLAYGTPDDVRKRCKEVIDGVARDGGYIMDASAIMQNDAKVENIKAMTDFTREYGVYSSSGPSALRAARSREGASSFPQAEDHRQPPGVVTPWEEKRRTLPPISGDAELVRRVWEEIDGLANIISGRSCCRSDAGFSSGGRTTAPLAAERRQFEPGRETRS